MALSPVFKVLKPNNKSFIDNQISFWTKKESYFVDLKNDLDNYLPLTEISSWSEILLRQQYAHLGIYLGEQKVALRSPTRLCLPILQSYSPISCITPRKLSNNEYQNLLKKYKINSFESFKATIEYLQELYSERPESPANPEIIYVVEAFEYYIKRKREQSYNRRVFFQKVKCLCDIERDIRLTLRQIFSFLFKNMDDCDKVNNAYIFSTRHSLTQQFSPYGQHQTKKTSYRNQQGY